MFQLTGGVSCTHQPCIFDIALTYLIHHYIFMCYPLSFQICQQYVLFFRCYWERETGWWLSKSLSCNLTIQHLCVCVLCVCVLIEVIRATTTWTETEETNGLLTAEAETLVEGISETVSVLAWGVTRWLRTTGRQKSEKKEEEKKKRRGRLSGCHSKFRKGFHEFSLC